MLYRRVSGGLGYLQDDIDLLSDFATAKGEADEAKARSETQLNGEATNSGWSAAPCACSRRASATPSGWRGGGGATGDRARQAELMEKTVADFSDDADAVIKTLSAASTELEATAQSLTSTADETSAQSQSVASAAEQASSNVQTVATASDELGASISEIGRQVTLSAQIAGNAVAEARKTNATVQGLAEAAQRIGEVVT